MLEGTVHTSTIDFDCIREGAYAPDRVPVLDWYALYVKSRHEFSTERELMRKGIETYLPKITRIRHWKDRKKKLEFSLFPGYVFVHIPPCQQKLLQVLKTPGAVKLVSLVPGHPSAVPDSEIDSIKILLSSGREYDIYPSFSEGRQVRITRGPLKGAEGIVIKRDGYSLFIVGIELLGRSIGIKVYADDLETAD